jgi:SAM-dependent methyltransferase
MEKFGKKYAEWYDAMYQEKNYDEEVFCVESWLQEYGNGGNKLACVGSGTLNHETQLAMAGYEIFGIDQSQSMVELAQVKIAKQGLKKVEVIVGDMRTFDFPQNNFDAVLIMFNVIGYCKDITELTQVFTKAFSALKPNGILIFDAWFADAVKKSPPFDRWRKVRYSGLDLYRMTHQEHLEKSKQVLLDIEVLALQGDTLVDRTREEHFVRYWDIEEIEMVAQKCGFNVVHTSTFPGNKPLTEEDWIFGAVLKRI